MYYEIFYQKNNDKYTFDANTYKSQLENIRAEMWSVFHPNIKLVRQIGRSVSFLDASIENNNGTLATSVFHKEAAEPYIVPFKTDHPRHIFKNIIDTALVRAIRYSSTLSSFKQERRSIKLTLLYNG